MKTKSFFLVLLILISCEIKTNQDIQILEDLLEVKLEDGFEIVNKQYEIGIGESIKSFDIIFEEQAFIIFFAEVENIFIPVDKTLIDNKNLDYYKNFEFDNSRIHLTINRSNKTLHYLYVDL